MSILSSRGSRGWLGEAVAVVPVPIPVPVGATTATATATATAVAIAVATTGCTVVADMTLYLDKSIGIQQWIGKLNKKSL